VNSKVGMVWRPRECHVDLIEAGDDTPAGGYRVRLTRIGVVVIEMEGEEISQSVICAIFESGGGTSGNNCVRSCSMVL